MKTTPLYLIAACILTGCTKIPVIAPENIMYGTTHTRGYIKSTWNKPPDEHCAVLTDNRATDPNAPSFTARVFEDTENESRGFESRGEAEAYIEHWCRP